MVDPDTAASEELVRLKIRTERIEHASRRIGMLLKLPLVLLSAALLVWLVAMVWDAWGSRGIAIERFHVAPSIASAGLDGDAVAARIRSHVIAMQADTASSRLAGVEPLNRVEDNQIEIPQTGLTLGEVSSEIRRWLSNDMQVSGDVTREGESFAINLRVDDSIERIPAQGFERDFDNLVKQAAESVFRESNPYRYAVYLWTVDRRAESTSAFARRAGNWVDPVERAWALNGLASNLLDEGRCADAVPILDLAARLGPRIPNVHGNLRNAQTCLGHDQAAADATAEELRLLATAAGQLDPEQINWLLLEDRDNRAGHSGDYRRRLSIYDEMEAGGYGDRSLERAQALAELHEASASIQMLRRWFAFQRWDSGQLIENRAAYWHSRLTQAASLGSWHAASIFAARARYFVGRSPSRFDRVQIRTVNRPLQAMALARAGEVGRASAMVSDLALDCYLCVRSRALVAEAAGDNVQADRWFARATALGPRLPFAYSDWGEALLRRGEAASALHRFEQALAQAPDYADAHKGRGDALYRLGRFVEAEQSYGEAARRAPRWGGLHMAWAQSLWRLGRRGEARAKLTAARTMDLNRQDAVRLRRMLAVVQGIA